MLFKWRQAIISKCGLKSTTRLLLLTLSVHMNESGGSCFPSTKTLAEETGLTERTICTHLEIAERQGWIKKMQQGLTGQRWKRHSYEALIPPKVLKEIQHLEVKGTEPHAEGTEPDDKKALKEVQSSSSYSNTSNNSSDTSDSVEYGLSKLLFDLILKRNPKHKKPNLQTWSKHIDRLMRLDKRTPAEVKAVIRWCQSDSFWQNNILSTEKLRKQFDQLHMKMEAQNGRLGNTDGKGTRSTKYSGIGKTINSS